MARNSEACNLPETNRTHICEIGMSPVVVCNNILQRAFDNECEVTLMKLQRLMYFVACEYLKHTHTSLFVENFEVWKYGPVLRSVYDMFSSFGSEPISAFSKDAKGLSYIVDESTAPFLADALDCIWRSFKGWDPIQLSKLTHEPGSGWSVAYDQYLTKIDHKMMESDNTYVHFIQI